MTRINAGISVQELHDKHLLAEHREIKRIPNCIRKGRFSMKDQPKEFTLGEGHVKFFYDKMLYLHGRYIELYNECHKRGFKVTSFHESFYDLPLKYYKDYEPTEQAIALVRERINERLIEMNK